MFFKQKKFFQQKKDPKKQRTIETEQNPPTTNLEVFGIPKKKGLVIFSKKI